MTTTACDPWAEALRHRRLVRTIARRFLPLARRRGFDLDDLVQEGTLGVLAALRSYRPEKGLWSTYCGYCVRTAIRQAIYRGNLVCVPRRRALREGLPLSDADAPPRPTRGDRIDAAVWAEVEEALRRLDGDEREVIRARFGLDRPEVKPYEIGAELGLMPHRARKVEKEAMRRLRDDLAGIEGRDVT